nr:MAG TPA: hypothetical protein [Caudoviricetes sp.]
MHKKYLVKNCENRNIFQFLFVYSQYEEIYFQTIQVIRC